MKESKRWQDILISAGIFAAATFIIAGLCGLVCAIFMLPLGFRYKSLWDIVVFFFWGSIVAIPVSLAAAALPKALYALGKLPRWGARLLYLALDSFATALGLAVVDLFLESVSATDASLWVAGLLLALPELKDVGKGPQWLRNSMKKGIRPFPGGCLFFYRFLNPLG